jgi:2-dehydropantoate 2-reductase
MKILVMGAGAVGAYFGARLQEIGEQVIFCARGENLRALRERDLEIKSPRGDLKLKVQATDRPAEFAPYDLILFCVKVYDTDAAAESIKGCIAPGGGVLTVQNGVENEDRLIELLGDGVILGGNARIGAELVAPGKVVHVTNGYMDFGELDGRETPRGKAYADAFRRAGILGEFTPRIRALRWDKLMWNAAFNTVSALTRKTVGAILGDPDGKVLIRTLMREVMQVARAEGGDITEQRIELFIDHSEKNLGAVRTSTLQDFERGKRLEYEALAGAVVRAARRHGIAAPASQTIYALLKLLDSRGR